ncbi:hypothetical protein [Aquimarina hainanensis]
MVIIVFLLSQSCEKDDEVDSIISNSSLKTNNIKKNKPHYSLSRWMDG